jgi:hypothetical protein
MGQETDRLSRSLERLLRAPKLVERAPQAVEGVSQVGAENVGLVVLELPLGAQEDTPKP